MSTNLENSAMAIGLEKSSFHSNPNERMFILSILIPKNVQAIIQLHSFHMLARLCSKSYNAGRPRFDPGSGRSSGEGNGNPLQYLCLENPMDGGAGRLQSMGSQRVGHDRATSLSLSRELWMLEWKIRDEKR